MRSRETTTSRKPSRSREMLSIEISLALIFLHIHGLYSDRSSGAGGNGQTHDVNKMRIFTSSSFVLLADWLATQKGRWHDDVREQGIGVGGLWARGRRVQAEGRFPGVQILMYMQTSLIVSKGYFAEQKRSNPSSPPGMHAKALAPKDARLQRVTMIRLIHQFPRCRWQPMHVSSPSSVATGHFPAKTSHVASARIELTGPMFL